MRFVANLRQETINAFAGESIQPAAYLLSSHRISPAALRAAAEMRREGLPLFADNGTKPLIEDLLSSFEERAASVRAEVANIRRQLGRVPRGNDVPSSLRRRAAMLAEDVVMAATEISDGINIDMLIDEQVSMGPTDLIAQEDFATACLLGLGIEREVTGWSVRQFDQRVRRSLRLWRRVEKDPRCRGIRVYAVVSAGDYNTARSAGRLAATRGARRLALGVAGMMSDSGATDFHTLGRKTIKLERPVPRRYLRLALILLGLTDGYRESGRRMESFHCLGLGAAPLLPIVAATLPEGTRISADATSPIHDAVRDRVLYRARKSGARASTREIVAEIVEGRDWEFSSPFTRSFRDQFGHDPAAARAAWNALGRPEITASLLSRRSALTEAVPLFAEAGDHVREASKVRIAHNHWVLDKICDALPDGRGRHRRADRAIERLLAGPPTVTTRGLSVARDLLSSHLSDRDRSSSA